MSEIRIGCLFQSLSTFSLSSASHSAYSPPIVYNGRQLISCNLTVSTSQCWNYKHMSLYLAYYISAEEANSGPLFSHICLGYSPWGIDIPEKMWIWPNTLRDGMSYWNVKGMDIFASCVYLTAVMTCIAHSCFFHSITGIWIVYYFIFLLLS